VIMESQRDVVFTPLVLRHREAATGVDVPVPLRLKPYTLRAVRHVNDDWVGQRARVEQVIAEANAMLNGRTELIGLDDRIDARPGPGGRCCVFEWTPRPLIGPRCCGPTSRRS
jgi:hypothetical protein